MRRRRDSEVSRVLPAPLPDVKALLTPDAIVRYEGSHEPRDVVAGDGRTVVTTWPNGSPFGTQYVFEIDDDRISYRQDSVRTPAMAIETTIRLEDRTDATRIRLRSVVESAVPIPFCCRFVAWRRRRRLERFCDRLAADLARTRVDDER